MQLHPDGLTKSSAFLGLAFTHFEVTVCPYPLKMVCVLYLLIFLIIYVHV